MRDTTPAPAHLTEPKPFRITREHIIRAAISLILALLLWGWVTQLVNPIGRMQYIDMPIAVEGLADSLTTVTTIQDATISVEGPESEIASLNRANISLSMDLSDIEQPGEYRVPIVIEAPDASARIESDPNSVLVQVERIESTIMPLTVEKPGLESTTREISQVIPEQTQITIEGPSSAVQRVDQVILPVTVGNQPVSFTSVFAPYAVDVDGQRVSEVTLRPAEVSTRVEIKTSGKVVSVIPVVEGSTPDGYSDEQRTVLPDSVVVNGPPEVLEDVLFVRTEPVDITGHTESFSQTVALEGLPEGVSVVEPANGNVEVRIAIGDSTATSQVLPNVPITTSSAPDSMTVTVDPPILDITIDGPSATLSDMQASDVQVIVDLAGLSSGEHEVTPQVVLPQGVRWIGSDPSTVNVTLEPEASASPTDIPTDGNPNHLDTGQSGSIALPTAPRRDTRIAFALIRRPSPRL